MLGDSEDSMSAAAEISTGDESLEKTPWQWWRDRMPVTAKWAYFDHAAVAPLSQPAGDAIAQMADQAVHMGDTVWPEWAAKQDALRTGFAELTGAPTGDICLVPNTTTGINLVAEGWPWKPGDSVVLPEGEFPSNLFPWLNQQSRGVEVRLVPRREGGEVLVEDLIDHCDATTRIISVSWVGYASGFRIDVDSLVKQAHQRGIAVFLDAIQGLGIFPIDLSETPVDFLAADGHKWLLGPEGAGVAIIRKAHLDRLRAGNVGWASVKNSFNYASPTFELRGQASRFEGGSANLLGMAGLAASLEMFLQVRRVHGANAIGERVVDLASRLSDQLQAAGAESRFPTAEDHQSGIVTFNVPGVEPAEVRRRGLEQHVVLSCRDGGVRAAIHAYNNDDDLDRLISLVKSLS